MGEKIRIQADPELREFLPSYLENRKRDLATLVEALEKQDFKTAQIMGHKIRGHALSYGFVPLSSICALIERAALAHDATVLATLIDEYREYIDKVEID